MFLLQYADPVFFLRCQGAGWRIKAGHELEEPLRHVETHQFQWQDVFNSGLESTQVIIVQHGSMGYYVLTLVSLDAFVSPLNSVLSCTLLSGEGPGKARVHSVESCMSGHESWGICSNTWFVDVDIDFDVCLSIYLLIHFLKLWREDSTEFDVKDRAPTKSWNLNVLGGDGQFRELTWVGYCSGLDSCFSFHSCYATAQAIFKMLS